MADNQAQLQDFLRVLHRRRWQIVLPAMFVLAIGSFFAVIVPKKYEVYTRIELRDADFGEGPNSTSEEVHAAQYHIQHYGRVRKVIEEQGDMWPEYVQADHGDKHKFAQDVTLQLDVHVLEKKKNEGSTFVGVSFLDVNGERAVKFLERLTKIWIEEVVERDLNRLEAERDILQNELREGREEYDTVHRQFMDLAKDMGIDPTQPVDSRFQNAGDPVFRALVSARAEREKIEADLAALSGELEELTEQLQEEPEATVEVVEDPGIDYSTEVIANQAEIRLLRSEQERLTPSNSRYRALDIEIAELERRIADLRTLEKPAEERVERMPNPEYDRVASMVAEKEALVNGKRRKLEYLNGSVADLAQEASKRTEDYKELAVLRGDMEVTWADVSLKETMLEAKEFEVSVLNDAGQRPFEIVEPPEASERPTTPNPWGIVTFSMVAGMALGLGLSLLAEFGRNAFRGPADLKDILAVPVLGTVNVIITRSEIRRRQLRRAVVGASSAVILGGLAWFTWVWASTPEKLPIRVLQAIDDLRDRLM